MPCEGGGGAGASGKNQIDHDNNRTANGSWPLTSLSVYHLKTAKAFLFAYLWI